jgi:hypothetical protein
MSEQKLNGVARSWRDADNRKRYSDDVWDFVRTVFVDTGLMDEQAVQDAKAMVDAEIKGENN